MFPVWEHMQCYEYGEEIYEAAVEQGKMSAEVFDLDKERYVPVMILSIGKAMEQGYESVRFAPEKITAFK